MNLPSYPVAAVRRRIEDSVCRNEMTVLQAPPGSGKSTIVPLYIAELLGRAGEIIVLQPRRAAVRAV
ncbi:MAG: hypothetical protein ACOCVC_07320, partial [Spirochaeta sp.]